MSFYTITFNNKNNLMVNIYEAKCDISAMPQSDIRNICSLQLLLPYESFLKLPVTQKSQGSRIGD